MDPKKEKWIRSIGKVNVSKLHSLKKESKLNNFNIVFYF